MEPLHRHSRLKRRITGKRFGGWDAATKAGAKSWASNFPTRTMVQVVALMRPERRLEIDANVIIL